MLGAEQSSDVECSVELCGEHAIERFQRLVTEQLVTDQAGAMNQADRLAELAPPAVRDTGQVSCIADIDLGVLDP